MNKRYWLHLRKDFPITERWTYLDHAAAGPLARPVYEEVERTYWDAVHHGDVHWQAWLEKREAIREKFARFIHAEPAEVAFVHSTSEGMNLIADLISREGSVLTNTLEFPSSTVPWLYRKMPVRFLEPEEGKIPLGQIKKNLGRTKIIVTSFVQYQNGFRQDLEALGKIKGNRYLVVNATQAFGVLPLNVRQWKADFLCAASYKWFMAGHGGGIFYIKKEWIKKFKPSFAGWRSRTIEENFDNRSVDLREQASRSEYGCPTFPVIFALGASLDYLTRIGIDAIEQRVLELTDYAIERLSDLGLEIVTPLERKYRSGIVVFKMKDPEQVVKRLLKKKIFVSPRGSGIRIAPHFYNQFSEIDRLIQTLKDEL